MKSFFAALICVALASGTISSTLGAADDAKPSTAETPESVALVTLRDALQQSADKKSPVRIEATLALGEVGLKAGIADPAAIELLLEHLRPGGDALVESAASFSLRKFGKQSLPAIQELLESNDMRDQATACNAIKTVGVDAIELLPALREMLSSAEASTQRAALYALQGLGDEAFAAIEEVAECLSSHDFNVQCMACRVLELYGEEAHIAENELVNILKTGNPSSRGWAAIVLGSIGPTEDHDIVNQLVARLSESRSQVEKQRILLGLAHLGREAKAAVPIVTEFLNTRSHHVQSHSAYALFKITGDEGLLTKTLTQALADQNYKHDALEIIERLGAEAMPLKTMLIKQLASSEEDVRERAVLAIGRLGTDAADAAGAVQRLILDPDVLVREAASQTLNAITPPTEKK